MTYYMINFEFSNQLRGETVATCDLKLETRTNGKRREIRTSNAIFFQTERSCYVRFNVNKERWTIELGVDFIDSAFNQEGPIEERDVYCNYAPADGITGNPFTWDCWASFTKKSKRCNKRVDSKAVHKGLKPLIFTIGDGTLHTITQDDSSTSIPVKFGPSLNELIELPTVTYR